jgi:hypothetical protein
MNVCVKKRKKSREVEREIYKLAYTGLNLKA